MRRVALLLYVLAAGCRFYPRLFGWMLHVMAFSEGDPWNAGHH